MYTPEFREEWGDDFPQVGFGEEFTPVSEKFWHEATALNIPGVGTDLRTPSPASGLVFEVVGDVAFEELRSRLRDKYAFAADRHQLPPLCRGTLTCASAQRQRLKTGCGWSQFPSHWTSYWALSAPAVRPWMKLRRCRM